MRALKRLHPSNQKSEVFVAVQGGFPPPGPRVDSIFRLGNAAWWVVPLVGWLVDLIGRLVGRSVGQEMLLGQSVGRCRCCFWLKGGSGPGM